MFGFYQKFYPCGLKALEKNCILWPVLPLSVILINCMSCTTVLIGSPGLYPVSCAKPLPTYNVYKADNIIIQLRCLLYIGLLATLLSI